MNTSGDRQFNFTNPAMLLVNSTANHSVEANASTNTNPGAVGFFDQTKEFTEFKVAYILNEYKYYALMVLSLIGNSLCLAVLKKRMQTSSACFYMGNLAIWDTVTIWSRGIHFIGTAFFIPEYGDIGCKISTFLTNFSIYYAIWIVVAMTMERFIAVAYPFKVATMCTVRRAKITVIALAAIFFLVNLQYFVSVTSVAGPPFQCAYLEPFHDFSISVWTWVDMSIYAILPLILVLTLNIMIISKVGLAQREKARLQNQSAKTDNQSASITVMLVTVSVTFFLLVSPFTVFYIYSSLYWKFTADPQTYARYLLGYTTVFLLTDLNHCVNFLLYFLSGKAFREDFKRLLCKFPSRGTTRGGMSTSVTSLSATPSNGAPKTISDEGGRSFSTGRI